MRSKKALALLLAASMVFTMNTSIFAGVKAASDDDGKVITQSSPDSHSPDEKDDPSGPDTPSGPDIPDIPDTPNKTVSAGEIPAPDDKGTSTIDKTDATNVEFNSDAIAELKKLANNDKMQKVDIKLSGSTISLPKAALQELLKKLGGDDFTISTWVGSLSSTEEYNGIKSATQEYYINLTTTTPTFDDDVDEDSVNVEDYNEVGVFSEPVGISFEATEATKKLDKANVYSLYPTTEIKTKEDVSDGTVSFETQDLSFAYFAVGAEAEAKGWISANFAKDAYVEEGGILKSRTDVEFIDSSEVTTIERLFPPYKAGEEEEGVLKTANKANSFKINAPIAVAPSYKFVKWAQVTTSSNGDYIIDTTAENPTVTAGGTAEFKPIISEPGTKVEYCAIVTPLNDVSTNVLKDINGHTVEVDYNKTPAYTGKKLNAGALVIEVRLDGKDVTDFAKFKIKGSKTVGSEVTITIKSIKGLDKDTNKALKDKVVGTATIRPIEASEVTLVNKYYTQEGQIAVKFKGDTVKKVTVMVPNGNKLDKNNARIRVTKAKKVNIKKGYEYDSSTKYIKFDGSVISGTVKVGVRSK